MRWKQSDPNFKSALIASEASKATTLLDAIRISGRKRWFLLSLMKRYADGQKQAQRIIKAVSKEGKILKEKLKKYNASVQVLIENGLDFNILSWEQASDVTTGIHKQSSVSPLQAWKRDAIEAYTLLQRAGEEINIIHSEMHSVILNAYKDCRSCDVATAISGHAGSLTTIQAGLLSIAKARQSHHHMHLQFAVQSLSKHVDISRDIDHYVANIQQVAIAPHCEAEEDILQSDEEEDFQDSQENIQNDISKNYLFDDFGSDSGLGTEC
ncbi:uncharacterized protein LOC114575406 [Exaiptasia diaphana]|uniref:Uncharacterized protein n=1 Tax=Exaiptasia diaphana TaxID=2652724 RepID=A0A913YP81_EXADI|nr:uncharacterized protein LOC114575406 [Exaiptasia diaphana]